ncbi:transposase family protein [Thiocapsa sp.]|uniref:transposase family protein n=1 Tax=Thiocapsa sp. TaxID=2024551 RepID=UPI00345C1098
MRRTLQIHVHSTLEGTHCHRCGKPIDHGYGLGQEIKLRHLPVFDYHTVLVLRPKRYQCHSCEGGRRRVRCCRGIRHAPRLRRPSSSKCCSS